MSFTLDEEKLRSCNVGVIDVVDPREYKISVIARTVGTVFSLYGIKTRTSGKTTYILGRVDCTPFFAKLVTNPRPAMYVVFPPCDRRMLDVLLQRYNVEIIVPAFLAAAAGITEKENCEPVTSKVIGHAVRCRP